MQKIMWTEQKQWKSFSRSEDDLENGVAPVDFADNVFTVKIVPETCHWQSGCYSARFGQDENSKWSTKWREAKYGEKQ